MILIFLFIPLLVVLFAFSYLWTDLAIVLMIGETKPWIFKLNQYRDLLGENRMFISYIFILLIFILTALQIYLLLSKRRYAKKYTIPIVLTSLLATLSFPFLSHDIFSYLFAAKILYVYHMNPYVVIPEVFRNTDLWLGFTGWTHRAYVYGPFYLLYSIVPMVISGGRQFIIAFFGMKIMNLILFLAAGFALLRTQKEKFRVLAYWFFNPLLIIELLINSHNEIVMISLFIISYVLIGHGRKIWGWVLFIFSFLTKFISGALLPGLILNKKYSNFFYKVVTIAILLYLGITFPKVQAWYYTWIYMAIPFAALGNLSLLSIFVFQFFLLWVKYYPFISTGGWNQIPLLPFIQALSILLPIIIIVTEYKNLKLALITKESPNQRKVKR